MGAQFTLPLIEVIPGQLIASALWNNEWNNINTNFIPAGMDSYSDTDAQMQIQTNPYPGSVTSHATSLGGEIERIRYQISLLIGQTFWYQAPATSMAFLANVIVPIGGIIEFPSGPTGALTINWALCDGHAISRTQYSVLNTLYAGQGYPFGAGDGSTTFNLPNYNDRISIGVNTIIASVGVTGGAATQVIGTANLPASPLTVNITDPGHTHSITDPHHAHGVTDPQHSHTEQVSSNNTGVGSSVSDAGHASNTNVSSSNSTANASTGLTVNSGSTGITGANSDTTGITASTPNMGSGTALPILPPVIGMYKIVRIL